MPILRSRSFPATLLGAAAALLPLAALAQALQNPAPGVLCDPQALRGSGVCYDSRGASPPLTGRYLGRRAEAS